MKNACKYYAVYTEYNKSKMLPLTLLNYPEGVKAAGFSTIDAAVAFIYTRPRYQNLPGSYRNEKIVKHDNFHFTVSYEYTRPGCEDKWIPWTRDYEIREEQFVLFDIEDATKGIGLSTI